MKFERPSRLTWAFLLLLAGACGKVKNEDAVDPSAGSGGDSGAGAAAGSGGDSGETGAGLALWQLESPGAPAFSLGFLDRQHQQHCSFVPAADGHLRCLPFVDNNVYAELEFGDASCSSRIYSGGPLAHVTPSDPPFTLPLPQEGCEPVRYVVGTLRPLPADAPHYYLAADGTCTLSEPNTDAMPPHATIAQLIPTEDWVMGVEADGATLSTRVSVREIEDGSGLSFPDHLVDEYWVKPCTLRASLEGDISCWPSTAKTDAGGLFSDAMCSSEPLVFADGCAAPAFIESGLDLVAFGERWTGPVFQRTKDCREVGDRPTPPGSGYFKEGEALGDDAIAPLAWQLAGTGRIQVRGLADTLGNFAPINDAMRGALLPAFHDTKAAQDCTPVWTPEGEVRCLPLGVPLGAYTFETYADSACSEPAYYCPDGAGCIDLDFVPQVVTLDGQLHADSLHRSKPLTNVYALSNGACVDQSNAGIPASIPFFATGPEAAWDKYPLFTERNGVHPR